MGAIAAAVILAANAFDAVRKFLPQSSDGRARSTKTQPYVWPAEVAGGLLASDGKFIPGEPEKNRPYYVNIDFENSAEVPAVDVRSHAYLVHGPDAAIILDQVFLSAVPESTGTVLAPGARTRRTEMTLDEPPMVYPARIVGWDNSWPLIVCGVVAYRSLKHENFTTRFCKQYMRGSRGTMWRGIEGKERIE
jgi:hypothetical protein